MRLPGRYLPPDGYLAGPDRVRADTLLELWTRPDIRAVMAARGGYGAMRIVDIVAPDLAAGPPKQLIGFSDITTLLLALYQETGQTAIHGPVVTSLADADEETLRHFYDLITGRPVFPLRLEGRKS